MTSHQFVFPPPPPPPPPTQPSYHNPGGPHNPWNNARGRGQSDFNRGSRGRGDSRGGSGGGSRGVPRGGSRGGNYGLYHTGFDSRSTNSSGHSYPLPQYPPGQQLHYPAALPNHILPTPANSTVPIAQPAPGVDVGVKYHDDTQRQVHFYSVQQDGTLYNYNFPNQNNPYNPQQAPQYVPVAPLQDNQYTTLSRGPPIRMGFGPNNYTAGDQHFQVQHQIQPHRISSGVHHLQHGSGPVMPPSFRAASQTRPNHTRYDSPNAYPDQRNRCLKRQHDGIAGQRRHKNKTSAEMKSKVAPAVPSFGTPLPVSLPPSQETEERPKKKKRRHNQLGLTPKSLEYESSEDENDADEEVKLADAAGLPSSDQLQFSYKGRTSNLQSFAEIAAWIEERKNRFPTKARVEEQKENQRQLKASQQAKRQVLKESTKPKQLAKPVEKQKATTEVKEEVESKDGEKKGAVTAEAAKSKAKLEKLRKELRKQEKRIAKAEAKASRLESEANKYQPGDLEPTIATGATKIKRSESEGPDREIKLEVVGQATFAAPTSAPHEDYSSNKAGGNVGETDHWIETTKNEDSKPINVKLLVDKSSDFPLDASKLLSEKADDKSTPEKAVSENHDIKLEDVELPIGPFTLSLQVDSSSIKNGEEAGSGDGDSISNEDNASAASAINPLTPISQPSPISKQEELHTEQNPQPHPTESVANQITSTLPNAQPPQDAILINYEDQSTSPIDSLSTTDSEDDITSSSGSSSSSSSSTPEAQPVRRALAEKAPPNKRRQNQQAKNICRSFVSNRGFCRKGQRCRYRHELPESRPIGQGKRKNNSIREQGSKNQRISLYQRLVAQEIKQEQEEKRQKDESAPIKREEDNGFPGAMEQHNLLPFWGWL